MRRTISAVIALGVGLSGCVSDNERLAQQQQFAAVQSQNSAARAEIKACNSKYPKDQRNRANAVPFAQCILTGLDHFVTKPNDIAYAIAYKRLALARSVADMKITLEQAQSEFASYVSEMRTQLSVRQSQERIASANEQAAHAVNCSVAQQHQANSDYSGIDSTSGAVAIISLAGAVAETVATVSACQ
jgi:hypothetical protein